MEDVLGVGCDIVHVARIARIAQRHTDIFLQRVMGAQERDVFGTNPEWTRCARHVAAKEAFFKALGTGLAGAMRWNEVQVIYVEKTPQLLVSGATHACMTEIGGSELRLSIGSGGQYAMATVILIGARMTRIAPKTVLLTTIS